MLGQQNHKSAECTVKNTNVIQGGVCVCVCVGKKGLQPTTSCPCLPDALHDYESLDITDDSTGSRLEAELGKPHWRQRILVVSKILYSA